MESDDTPSVPSSIPTASLDMEKQELEPEDMEHHETPEEPQIQLTIHHHGEAHEVSLPESWKLSDLSSHIAEHLAIPASHQKFMITPKVGTLKPPFATDHLLSSLTNKKIVLMGSSTAEISDLSSRLKAATALRRPSPIKPATPAKTRDWRRAKEESTYTFHQILPLPHLPDAAKAQRYLERLAHDPGIVAAMRAHKFSVGLLTEMDPAAHTTHASRTLGLNRNAGEAIELRLRTDAYDGFRDYRGVRRTLCHELAHNVFGPHDRDFWDLTRRLEREVERGDWSRGGRAVADDEFYNPEDAERGGDDDAHVDVGGWVGGSFVLGGGSTGHSGLELQGLDRREAIRKAAEERLRKLNDISRPSSPEGDDKKDGGPGKSSGKGSPS